MNMMSPKADVFELYSALFESRKQTELSLRDYLTLCRDNTMTFANAAERMIAAIGEPEVIDTSMDSRLGRIFMNRSIKRYKAFSDFFGKRVDRVTKMLSFSDFAIGFGDTEARAPVLEK